MLTNDHCLEGYVDKIEKDETGPTGKVEKVTREVFKDMDLVQKAYQGFDEVGSTTYQAKILFHVRKYDLAILQIKADTITQSVFSQVLPPGKDVKRGDPVYVVGNPYMLDANLNEGHVSSINRKLTWDDGEEIPYFGVDAGVNPGNSGGALYNSDLDLIGVPGAAMRGASGLGFAIPYTLIRKLLDENCYSDVWDAGAKQDHKTCEQAKLDKENAARAKAGLPPLDKAEPDSLGAGIPATRAMRLIDRARDGAASPIDLFPPLQ